MDYKVKVRSDKTQAFEDLMSALEKLDVIESFEIVRTNAEITFGKSDSHQEWSSELTADLAATEFVKRYRDLVD